MEAGVAILGVEFFNGVESFILAAPTRVLVNHLVE